MISYPFHLILQNFTFIQTIWELSARPPPPPPPAPPLPPRPLFPLKSPQSLANAAKIRIIKWYISYRKGEQKLWQIKRKW